MPKADQDLYEPDGRVFALFREISGASNGKRMAGEVWVEDLGLVCATLERFKLRRLAESGAEALLYDFVADCRTVSPAIMADDEYHKTVLIRIGTKQYRVEPKDGQRMVLTGRTRLSIEEVALCPR